MKVPPNKLITPIRIDVFTRTPVVRNWVNNEDAGESIKLYLTFIQRATLDNGFIEDNGKRDLNQYLLEFRRIFDSMTSHGFIRGTEPIPVKNNVIQNGAHRTAIAIVCDINVYVEEITSNHSEIQDYKYLQKIGFPENMIQRTILEYLNYDQYCRALFFFDLPDKKSDLLISKINDVVYRRKLHLNQLGKVRLMKILYGHTKWWDDTLSERFIAERFNRRNSSVDLIIFRSGGEQAPQNLKKQLRSTLSHFTFDRRIHGTDDWKETMYVCRHLLNENTINFMNTTKIGVEKNLIKRICGMGFSEIEKEKIVITNGSVLELYGLRKAKDFDILSVDIPISEKLKATNDEYVNLGNYPRDYIINPSKHIFYLGYKFLSLSELISFKLKRNSKKDIKDFFIMLKSKEKEWLIKTPEYKSKRFLSRIGIMHIVYKLWLLLPENQRKYIKRVVSSLRTNKEN